MCIEFTRIKNGLVLRIREYTQRYIRMKWRDMTMELIDIGISKEYRWYNLITRDLELGVSGRKKESAQKVAMRSEGGNQLGLPAQWYKGSGRKHSHDLRGCREKCHWDSEVSVSTRMKRRFRRGCGYWWFHWWRLQVLGSRIWNIRNFMGLRVPTSITSLHYTEVLVSAKRQDLRMRKKQNLLLSNNTVISLRIY